MVVSLVAAWLLLQFTAASDLILNATWLVGGLLVATVGYLDDRSGLDPRIRLIAHFFAASLAVVFASLATPHGDGQSFPSDWAGSALAIIGIVWFLNLFNFMDGIDGLASSEAAFVAVAAALLLGPAGLPGGTFWISLYVAASAVGFLLWNWPPARIFLGDIGSGFLGYVLAVLALVSAQNEPANLYVWFTLAGVFLVDASVTLVRRLTRRVRVFQAHRTHAYQLLARRWSSHRAVTTSILAINAMWLLPLAWWISGHPSHAEWVFLAAVAPLGVAAVVVGAGRSDAT
jgi:Fuc2NAc and GlcNAc transferase